MKMKQSDVVSVAIFLLSVIVVIIGHPHPPCDSTSGGAEIIVEFAPDAFLLIPEGVEEYVNATVYGIVGNITVSASSGDPNSFETFFNETEIADVDGNITLTIPVRGRKLSISSLVLNITHVYQVDQAAQDLLAGDIDASGDGGNVGEAYVQEYTEPYSFQYDIKVSRKRTLIELVFTYSLLAWLVISYVTMGAKMDLVVIWNKLRRPYGVLTGIACQFIIMPLIAFALAQSPGITPEAAVGLLVIGSCPGGWISNVFALLMDVDFVLSLTMTFCSSFMALGMMPLNMLIYGSKLTGNSSGLRTPYKDIVMQLGLMLIPVGFGIYISHKNEKVAKFLLKCLKPMACGLIIIALSIGIPSQVYIFDASWRIYLICFSLPFCGGTLGFLISKLLRRTNKEALTISFETGVQNSLLAVTVAKLSYKTPEADLIARIPFLVAVLQMLEGTVMIVTYVVVRRVLIRVGKIARPDTGDYQPCDIEAKRDDAADEEEGDEMDDVLREEEKQALKGLNIDDAFELKIDPSEKNGYVKMKEEGNGDEVGDDFDDNARKAMSDSENDGKSGYVKMKEDNGDIKENDEAFHADPDYKRKEVEIHPDENLNNNSDVLKTSTSITLSANDVPKGAEDLTKRTDGVSKSADGAENECPRDPAERETNI